jgi:Tfp pilus assembly protein PilP
MTSLWIVALAASAAAQSPSTVQNTRDRLSGAQSAPASAQPTAQPSQLPYKSPTTQGTFKTATPPAAATTPSKASNFVAPTAKPKMTVIKPKATAAKRKASPKAAKPAAEKKEEPSVADAAKANQTKGVVAGKRDPFVSPVVERTASGAPPGCTGGKKCLVAESLSLRGIVKSNGTLIAVVVTGENRAYFLRVNDPVYNGVVIKISESSVVFREQGTDVLGKPITREVVKKINTQA